ncbi:cysteine dioxygenase family protein [Nonomuraea typhae]|uniref:cysteine dioxygenase family protein n=1 Tax=Nonomuraea typhae TaxID=2603600 RepID=UPI0012FCA281|nr:cysteine dioxygenase family protein [Nonomuraea typhae]
MTLLKQPLPTAPRLDPLVSGIRAALNHRGDWQRTAQHAASELRRYLPAPEMLTGIPPGELLHVEPDGTFSIQAIVWPAGRITRIHDHVTWCVFGVIQGVLDEELFTLDGSGDCLVPVGRSTNATGAVNGFAPPGDIHRVANNAGRTAISIHVYGTDLSRIGSSALRSYDLPVRP